MWSSIPLRFHYPELLLLALPLWFLFRKWGTARGVTGWIRGTVLALLLLVLSGPEWSLGGEGIDVICVVDRSLSMPDGAQDRILEIVHNLEKNRTSGDRVGVVIYGQAAAVELFPSQDASVGTTYAHQVLPDGSDLEMALQTALNICDPYRPARILVLSDGESNGAPLSSAIRRAQELDVPIDFREFPRLRTGDLAIGEVLLPETIAPNEPFQFSVVVAADRAAEGTLIVTRGGQKITEVPHTFVPGNNPVLLRDIIGTPGLHHYEVELKLPEGQDPLPANNVGAGVVRVEAESRLLVLNDDGQPDNLTRALTAGKLPVDVVAASQHPLTQDSLEAYRGVIIENVPARAFGRVKMERLAQFVEDLGGGLLVTGGERSFGTGGYFQSPLDEVLPVSMEMRVEHRKSQIAISIALDRSGSMMAPVTGGKSKMDLANLGTAECIKLLSPMDSVSVIAVDSSPHTIQAQTTVNDPAPIVSKVKSIESMGGGIFVYEALVAAGNELIRAPQTTKHIILFSDANDSEEPGDYKNLLAKYEKLGITTSVIGLGKPGDVDAPLLEDIAKLGKGNIMFTEDAQELPRLFTEDTLSVARSTFITADPETQPMGISATMLPNIRLLGEFNVSSFPNSQGYNLCYLKPKATLGVVSEDEFDAPWSAFWYRGLGRCAALTIEADGQHSGAFGRWDGYPDFLVTQGRWLLEGEDPGDTYLKVEHSGQDAVVTLELDPQQSPRATPETPVLTVVPPGDERQTPLELPFEWQGAHTLQARFRLTQFGTYRPLVKLGPRMFVRGPSITLPYSPEYAPRIAEEDGVQILKNMAERTNGKQRVNPLEMFADPPRSSTMWSLAPLLFILALLLLVLEIAGRRLSLWERIIDAVITPPATVPQPAAVKSPAPAKRRWWPLWSPGGTKPARAKPLPAPTPVASEPATPPKEAAPAAPNPLDLAKARAKRRKF